METIIVFIIVGIAVIHLARTAIKNSRKNDDCSSGCSGCMSANSCKETNEGKEK